MDNLIFIILLIVDFVLFYLIDPVDINIRTESYETRKRKRFIGLMLFWSFIIGTFVYYGIKYI